MNTVLQDLHTSWCTSRTSGSVSWGASPLKTTGGKWGAKLVDWSARIVSGYNKRCGFPESTRLLILFWLSMKRFWQQQKGHHCLVSCFPTTLNSPSLPSSACVHMSKWRHRGSDGRSVFLLVSSDASMCYGGTPNPQAMGQPPFPKEWCPWPVTRSWKL